MIFEALMAVAGAGYGVYQAGERGKLAQREADRSLLMYEATKKRARAEESILENNLTIGAMDNTANNRDSAIAEFQSRSMQEAQAGVSGVTSGTPFYKIDSDAILNRQKLDELSTRGRLGVEGIGLQLDATKTANQAAIQQSVWQAQDALASSEYANSPFAYIMGGLTGALSGAAMGANISTLTKDAFDVTVDEAIGGLLSGPEKMTGTKLSGGLEPKTRGEYSLMSPDHEVGRAGNYSETEGQPLFPFQPTTFGDRFTSRPRTPVDYFRIDSNMAVPFMGTRSSGLSLASLYPSAMGIKYPGIPSMNTSQSSPFPTLGGTN